MATRIAFSRDILTGEPTVLAGAHDALSAKLIEEAGFDGVWASSFGISLASRCLPDTDLITMTENLDAVRQMVDAVSVPVVADVSAGYGNILNVRRMATAFCDAGAAGICIEDNPFPKICSLYGGWRRELASVDEMSARVASAKDATARTEFCVIARTEALIADLSADEALGRAQAYADAGADAVLIHAKDFGHWQEAASGWSGGCPLVVVPTLFPEASVDELVALGAQVVIFPNQAVRAAILSTQHALATLRSSGRGNAVDREIVPLAEVYRLVDLDGVRRTEAQYASQSHPVIA